MDQDNVAPSYGVQGPFSAEVNYDTSMPPFPVLDAWRIDEGPSMDTDSDEEGEAGAGAGADAAAAAPAAEDSSDEVATDSDSDDGDEKAAAAAAASASAAAENDNSSDDSDDGSAEGDVGCGVVWAACGQGRATAAFFFPFLFHPQFLFLRSCQPYPPLLFRPSRLQSWRTRPCERPRTWLCRPAARRL